MASALVILKSALPMELRREPADENAFAMVE